MADHEFYEAIANAIKDDHARIYADQVRRILASLPDAIPLTNEQMRRHLVSDFVIRDPDAPATPKQIETLQNLARTRDVEEGMPVAVWMSMWESWALAGITTMGFASQKIDEYLLADYRKNHKVDPGYYTTGSGHAKRFFVVVKTKDGERVYAKELVKVDQNWKWEYVPGQVRQLLGLTPLTIEEAAEWGKLHGRCIICGRTLSDPPSVERGIGPSCAKKIVTIQVS